MTYEVRLECDCEKTFVDPPTVGGYAYCYRHGDTEVAEAYDAEINLEVFDAATGDAISPSSVSTLEEYHHICVCFSPQEGGFVYYFADKMDGVSAESCNVGPFDTSAEALDAALATLASANESTISLIEPLIPNY